MSSAAKTIGAARFAVWALMIVAAVWAGLALRDWTFRTTAPIRFHTDVNNAVLIGRHVVVQAARAEASTTRPAAEVQDVATLAVPSWPRVLVSYFDLYDIEYKDAAARGLFADNAYRVDYPPGRLLLVSAWCKHVADERGLTFAYDDQMVTPMRWVNTGHEFVAALGAGALVWQALRRSGTTPVKAEMLALWAGLLLWFNPALLLDAHGWPQWDAWVLPYTLWAMFFALRNRWLMSGVLLAIGALFKGQVLLIAPLFVMWPLFQLRFGAALRLAIGMAAAFAILMSPWLVFKATPFAVWWSGIAIALVSVIAFWPRARTLGPAWWLATCALLGWLCVASVGVGAIALPIAVVGTALFCSVATLSRRNLALPLAMTALLLLGAGIAFGGSFAWLHVGFQTDRYPVLHAGNTANLGAILERFYGYGSDSPVAIGRWTLPLRMLLRWIAYGGIAIASLGVSLRDRSRDANVLVGFIAAWTVLYAIMPQMHERYLLWAAATSAILAARSVGGLFVHLALTALQVAMILCSMIESAGKWNDPTWGPIHFIARGMSPAAGWSTLTLAGVLLTWSFARSRLPSRLREGPGEGLASVGLQAKVE